jgi:hypothetical protein
MTNFEPALLAIGIEFEKSKNSLVIPKPRAIE